MELKPYQDGRPVGRVNRCVDGECGMPSLTWLTRDDDLKRAGIVPYRLLEADPALSHGDPASGNMLIQGDNLDALKALLPYYKGRVKCIYIDPPYNTHSDFEHYDDNLEHTQWLSMIYPRLELLHDLLAEDGSIWISIDDNEGHYLKVIMDSIFGRRNFVANVIWQKKYAPANNGKWLSNSHDHILVYAKSKKVWRPIPLPRTDEQDALYKNPNNDPRGPWRSDNYTCNKSADERPNLYYAVINPNTGEEIWPKRTAVWRYSKERHDQNIADGLVYWGANGRNSTPRFKRMRPDKGRVVQTIWPYDEVGHTQDAKREQLALDKKSPFATPKPEHLLKRIVSVASRPGDIVLDSFAGSGTTGAVAHKMGRRWIGVEMGEHAVTHCASRMVKVIEGEQGGISKAVNWQGGGGFRFYRLGEPVFDDEGRIRPGIKFPDLAAHIWFSETGIPYQGTADSPWLGTHGPRGLALLYNGILGDKSVTGGNVLTDALLTSIRQLAGHDGPLTIYGEASRFGAARLKAEGVTFKQTPYDVKGR